MATEMMTAEEIEALQVVASSSHPANKGWVAIKNTQLTALLAMAQRLLELERKALRVTHRDVTPDEIEHVTGLAIDARNALLTPGGSSAPIVRWLMWQEDRGLAVALELLQRDERLRELEGALEFISHPATNDHDISVEEWPTRSDGTGRYRLQVGYVDATTSATGATAAEAHVALAHALGWQSPTAKGSDDV